MRPSTALRARAILTIYSPSKCDQKTLATVANNVKEIMGDNSLGGARWAHNQKCMAPCPAAKVYRYITKQAWAKGRFPRESEVNTSCKCSRCLGMNKMVHPRHARVYGKRSVQDANGQWKKERVMIVLPLSLTPLISSTCQGWIAPPARRRGVRSVSVSSCRLLHDVGPRP